LQEQYKLNISDAALFTDNRDLGLFFEQAAELYNDYQNLAKWVKGDLLYQARETGKSLGSINPGLLVELLELIDSGQINRPTAKELLAEMVLSGDSPKMLMQAKGLGMISGDDNLLPLVEQVISENPDAVENYRQGKEKAIAFLVGKVMALSGGRADPGQLNRMIREKISS
jgi:aspartyl-tRNA(Asn)/glutamyl-tRNA(Gln) amidotransferase subunit B